MYFFNRLLKQRCYQDTSKTATQWILGESLNTLGNSLSASMFPPVTLDQIILDILLFSHLVDQDQKDYPPTMVVLLGGDPSGQDMTSIDEELPAVVPALVAIVMGQAVVMTVVLMQGTPLLV